MIRVKPGRAGYLHLVQEDLVHYKVDGDEFLRGVRAAGEFSFTAEDAPALPTAVFAAVSRAAKAFVIGSNGAVEWAVTHDVSWASFSNQRSEPLDVHEAHFLRAAWMELSSAAPKVRDLRRQLLGVASYRVLDPGLWPEGCFTAVNATLAECGVSRSTAAAKWLSDHVASWGSHKLCRP